jgi:hypothetical protein
MRRWRFTLLLLVTAVPVLQAWEQTSTEHFTFVYKQEFEFAAAELVGFADEVYDTVAALFESPPTHIRAVLFGETDLANGYFDPNPPQHMGLFVVQPSSAWIGAGAESWLRLLLIHELTHYLQANYSPGLFSALGSILGTSIGALDIGLVPLWLTEGLAIHTESTLTGGGRQTDPSYEMYERALVLEDQLFTLEQAAYASHLSPPGRQYVAGGFLVEYMVETYGESFIAGFMEDFSRFPLFGMWGPIERVTGRTMPQIYSDASVWLSERYERFGELPDGRQISPEVVGDYYLPEATSHGWYAYRERPDERSGIVRFSSDGTEDLLLPIRLTDPDSWSVTADGRLIVFATISVDRTVNGDAPLESNLYIYHVEQNRIESLTESGGYYQPRITSDTERVIAVKRLTGFHEVVEIPLSDPQEYRTLLAETEARYYHPRVSPDGQRAVVTQNVRGNQLLVLVDLQTASARALPRPANAGAPDQARFIDETTLFFTALHGETVKLFRHELNSDAIAMVGQDRIGIRGATSIDGRIIYQSYRPSGETVRELNEPVVTPVSASQPMVPSFPSSRTRLEAEPYVPIAWPRYWLPSLGFSAGVPLPSYLGFGAVVAGRNLTGTTSWSTQALYFPSLGQIGYNIGFSQDAGVANLGITAGSDYGPIAAGQDIIYLQTFSQALQAIVDVRNDYSLGVSRRLALTGGVAARFAFASAGPFTITELGSRQVTYQTPLGIPSVGIITARSPLSAEAAATPPWAAGLRIDSAYPFSLNDGALESFLLGSNGFLNVGVGGNHVLRLEPSATWASEAAYAAPFGLRGFNERTVLSAPGPGHFKVSAEYLPPHLLTDIPLLSGVGITRFGVELFAEITGGFSLVEQTIDVDEAIGFGIGVTTVITYLADWPVTGGVAFRIKPGKETPFRLGDFAFYLDFDIAESLSVIGSTFRHDYEDVIPVRTDPTLRRPGEHQ